MLLVPLHHVVGRGVAVAVDGVRVGVALVPACVRRGRGHLARARRLRGGRTRGNGEDEWLLHELPDLTLVEHGAGEAHVGEGIAHGEREELMRALQHLEALQQRHAQGVDDELHERLTRDALRLERGRILGRRRTGRRAHRHLHLELEVRPLRGGGDLSARGERGHGEAQGEKTAHQGTRVWRCTIVHARTAARQSIRCAAVRRPPIPVRYRRSISSVSSAFTRGSSERASAVRTRRLRATNSVGDLASCTSQPTLSLPPACAITPMIASRSRSVATAGVEDHRFLRGAFLRGAGALVDPHARLRRPRRPRRTG